jgi:hypothetical protein
MGYDLMVCMRDKIDPATAAEHKFDPGRIVGLEGRAAPTMRP